MNLLLDTHIFIWWLNDDVHLSKKARALIDRADNIYVSSASIWEAAIKVQLGKLKVDIDLLVNSIALEGFIELPISIKHAASILHLAHHHRDPFDRILISQALSEPLRFLTADKTLPIYSDLVELV
ncbi:MAG: twitching motility protein PilT [Legionellales bacterium RIFCSPHIGHO2_12_FULL_42_9]|nr:MAG: twitching motility protein PilT [Legionellales bacterium RIFCSPHIGHO2_12_FULL_42_9]